VAVIALVVKLDSPGPVVFRQPRVGRGGRVFEIYKFRTMVVGAPQFSAAKIGAAHPLVTRIGGFLRRACLDELLQLVNVVKGEMSWIGPRPEQLVLAHLHPASQAAREQVLPGVTGWWQVHHRDDSPLAEGLAYDLEYIERFGPLMDLRVVLATFRVLCAGFVAALREAWRGRGRGAGWDPRARQAADDLE